MKIRILRATTIHDEGGGSHRVEVGDVEDVDRATAQLLIGMGKAENYSEEPVIEPAPYEIETATVEPPEDTMAPPARRARRS